MSNITKKVSVSFGALILLLASLTPTAQADEACLKFGGPFISIKGLTVALDHFKAALNEANICATFMKFPMGRYSAALIEGRVDGVVFRVPAFKKVLGDSGYMVPEPVISGTAFFVSLDPNITSLAQLKDHPLGIRQGTVWTKEIVANRPNVIESSSYDNLVELLVKKRVSALLINSATAEKFKQELKVASFTAIGDLSVYVWLSAKQKHRSDEINKAIRAYKATGRTFLDPIPTKK